MSHQLSEVLEFIFPKPKGRMTIPGFAPFVLELLKELKESEGLEYENSWCETFGDKRKFDDDYSIYIILGIFDNYLLPNCQRIGTIKISSLLNLYSIERINQM